MLDLANLEHAAADARLRTEPVIWLTTVTKSGQPRSSPVWFLWDGTEFLIFGLKDRQKVGNIATNPRVGLNLDGDGNDGGIVVIEGTARVDRAHSVADMPANYADKYGARIAAFGWTAERFIADRPHAIRVTPTRFRVWGVAAASGAAN